MGTTTADRLAEATEAAAVAANLQSRLDHARERVLVSARPREEAASRLAEEDRAVERLRGFSWSGVLASVKGTRDDDLRREEAEVVDARLAAGHAEQRELREALDAGRAAQDHLVAALDRLRSADNWAAWDTFGRGGLLTDTIKYDRLREVGDRLEAAGGALRRFDAEPADVHVEALGAVEVGDGERVLDVWFDNVFSDWQVLQRIDDAVRRTREALDRVRDVGQRLEAREREVAASRTVLADERVHLLGR